MLTFHPTIYTDTIYFFSESGILFALWKKSVGEKDFIRICEIMYEIIVDNKLSFYLGDVNDMGVRDQATLEWLDNDLFPRMKKAGINRAALVISDNIETKFAVSSWGNMIRNAGVETEYFEDIEAAKLWLLGKTAK